MFTKNHSVNDIVSDLQTTLDRLQAAQDHHNSTAHGHVQKAEFHTIQADEARVESSRASRIQSKLAELLA